MKTFRLMIAVIVTAVSVLIVPQGARGEAVSKIGSLPAVLPIGGEQAVRDWVVSTNGTVTYPNRPSSHIFMSALYFNGPDGTLWSAYKQSSRVGFGSYAEFMSEMANIALQIATQLQTNSAYYGYTGGPVWFNALVTYGFATSNARFTGFDMTTNVGSIVNLTKQKLIDSMPLTKAPSAEYVVMTNSISKVKVSISDTPQPCWYTWSNGVVTTSDNWSTYRPSNQPDLTRSGFVVFPAWYATGRYHGTVEISTPDNEVATYSLAGDRLISRVYLAADRRSLVVESPPGQNTLLQWSTNMVCRLYRWQTIMSFPPACTNTVPMPMVKRIGLFRVIATPYQSQAYIAPYDRKNVIVEAIAGSPVTLQTSVDFTNWVTLQSFPASSTNKVPIQMDVPMRFYRLTK